MKEQNEDLVKRTKALLTINRHIVGVKFLFSKNEYEALEIENTKRRMPYCKMVEHASQGKSMKVNIDNFACFAGARVLGMVDIDSWYQSGNYYHSCGLYKDKDTAEKVTEKIGKCNHKIYGLFIAPLEDCEEADIVIIISNPFNMMRLIQGYTYIHGPMENFQCIGNQALCAECTARPYEKNDINLSLLCVGTRETGIENEEMALGMVYSKFISIVEGLSETLNLVENNKRKEEIEINCKNENIKDIKIKRNLSYGTPLFKYDNEYFLKK